MPSSSPPTCRSGRGSTDATAVVASRHMSRSRSAIPSGREVPLVEPLATVARSRSHPALVVVDPFGQQFVPEDVRVDGEHAEEFLSVQLVGSPVSPRRLAAVIETLHQDERLDRGPPRFERKDVQATEDLCDG